MPYVTPWEQPYPELKTLSDSEVRTLRIDLPASEARVITSLATNPSIFSFICQHALKSAIAHVRANNLTYLTADELIRWVRERSVGGTPSEATGSNVPGGDTSVRTGTAPSAVQPALSRTDATDEGEGRGRGRGGVGSAGIGSGNAARRVGGKGKAGE